MKVSKIWKRINRLSWNIILKVIISEYIQKAPNRKKKKLIPRDQT